MADLEYLRRWADEYERGAAATEFSQIREILTERVAVLRRVIAALEASA